MVFDFDGGKYKKASAHQKEWGTKVITDLALQGHEKVLDLGCGDGMLSWQIAALLPQGSVLGIDASPGMMNTARELTRDNLCFQLMDINEICFDQEFDVVFSNAALHWVNDHDQLIQNIYRALKPGGILRLNFGGDGNCANFCRIVQETMELKEYHREFDDFTWPWYMPKVDEYKVLMEKLPFQEVKIWLENADKSFGTKTEMIDWIDQPCIVPFLKHVDAAKGQSFRDQVVDEMIKNTKQKDTYFEVFRRINVYARK